MHPGFWGYWHQRRHAERGEGEGAAACGPAACGSGHGHGHRVARRPRPEWYATPGDEGGGFGVRRPLRFLAHKLELEEDQVTRLATILSTLKTERAQAEVDQRRRTSALASAIEGEAFDADKVEAAEQEQARSAERLQRAVKVALAEIHALLGPEQRKKLAYLLRTGVLSV